MKDKDRLLDKGLDWNEFEERLDKVFKQIEELIQDTNDNKID